MKNEDKATLYCEMYGIIPYKVTRQKLVYYANHPKYLSYPRRTYKVTVRLKDMKEESRVILKKWNSAGNVNMYK